MALNQELAKQEQIQPKTGSELALEVALATPLIRECTADEIKQSLKLVMIKVGLRAQNWPSEEEKIVLIDHIITNFGGHRINEIRLAFDMAISGRLDIDDVSCYENFSCAYFSKIMVGYRKWSMEAARQLKTETPPAQRIFTQEELDDSAREDVERQYSLFLKGHQLRGTEINKAILEKDGLIKEGETVLDFFKRKVEAFTPHIYIRNV
jgi:hypothetical protein